jgi:hypothetical protein
MTAETETSTAPVTAEQPGTGNGLASPAFNVPPEAIPDLDKLVIEDDTPVDSVFAEKQERLLTEPLYASWPGPGPGRTFQAFANVGLFWGHGFDPFVPDVMLAVDVPTGGDLDQRPNRSYFVWLRGKAPDIVIEFVSDRRGREEDLKWLQYARRGVRYYVIFDPANRLGHGVVRAYTCRSGGYRPMTELWFPVVGLGLRLWQGTVEGHTRVWLRWCSRQGHIILTGQERADDERQKRLRVEAQLRALGMEHES